MTHREQFESLLTDAGIPFTFFHDKDERTVSVVISDEDWYRRREDETPEPPVEWTGYCGFGFSMTFDQAGKCVGLGGFE